MTDKGKITFKRNLENFEKFVNYYNLRDFTLVGGLVRDNQKY